MSRSESSEMMEVLNTQKTEANTEFFKFVSKNYAKWIKSGDGPLLFSGLYIMVSVQTSLR